MSDQIAWETDWIKGLTNAGYEEKNIFLDFDLPTCIGCQQMKARTYSDNKVAAFINEHLVPIQLPADGARRADEELGERFGLRWTPHILIINARERVLRMTDGWFAPEELIPWIIMGLAMDYLHQKNWNMVRNRCQWIINDYPQSHAAPEAIYYFGVAGMRAYKDERHLKEMLATLRKKHPDSEWTMRAWPYGKL